MRLGTAIVFWLTFLCLLAHWPSLPFREAAEVTALKTAKSTAGKAMVPYLETIPGTEVSFEMLPIPAGKFTLGSPASEPGRSADEGPQVEINVEPFWMGKHEVTWGEYLEFTKLTNVFEKFNDQGLRQVTVENQVDAVTAPSKLYDPGFTFETGDDPRQPAVSMSQFAAKQYTKWLSLLTGDFYRLPTEAEWEYACRAGTQTAYYFGDDPSQLPQYAWYYENAEEDYVTAKVGQFKPNPWGLLDMHGNVWEWVIDGYEEKGYAKLAAAQQQGDLAVNWPTKRFPRVLRGGSWYSEDPARLRSAARLASDDDQWRSYDPNTPKSPWWFASDEGQTVGFRIVRPVHPPPKSQWSNFWDADLEEIQRDADRRIDKEGRGKRGIIDPDLPKAIKALQ